MLKQYTIKVDMEFTDHPPTVTELAENLEARRLGLSEAYGKVKIRDLQVEED